MKDNRDTPESWEAAKGYAALFGAYPSSFTSAIRRLLQDAEQHNEMQSVSAWLVSRLARGPSLKAILYYAAASFRQDELAERGAKSVRNLVRCFKPFELGVLLSLSYSYRRAQRLCSEEQWPYINEILVPRIEVGRVYGDYVPDLGAGIGLLVGGFPFLAATCFALHDDKGFKEYRRLLKKEKKSFAHNYERQRWGCTQAQVTSILVQSSGLGLKLSQQLAAGLQPEEDPKKLPNDTYRFYITQLWIDELINACKIPDMSHRAAFYPEEDTHTQLLSEVRNILDFGADMWIGKTKEDLSPEKTPELFATSRTSKATESSSEEVSLDDLPPDVRNSFDDEELKRLASEEIEALIRESEDE